MKKATIWSRALAQLIDLLIVSLIVSIVTYNFDTTRIDNLNEEALNLMEQYTEGEINTETYINNYIDIIYDINTASIGSNLAYFVICIGYYLIFQFLNKGSTIGKKIMKIKIINQNGTDVNFLQMFIRTSIINEIIPMGIVILLGLVSSGTTFYLGYSIISFAENLFIIICIFMILYRKDQLALHDILSKSIVVQV